MGYGGLSNILDRINQARGDAPAEPWSERLPNGASANNPGMRPPIVIEPQDDAPNTRSRGAMQLDSSNLAGPVPTNLSGDSQPFDYSQILNRGTTDSGQPQMDTSPARVDAIQSPTQGRFTVDSMGVPRETPNASGMPPPPPVPLYTRNKNSAGQVRPLVDTYQQGVDANGNHIGRGARFVDSFLANGGIGNPVGALFGGLLGLAAPSLGNRAAYNLDNSRFNRGLQQDLSNERADPGYQKQLDVWQFGQELPGKIAQQQAYQQAIGGRQLAVGEQRDENRQTLQDQKDAAALERLGATWDAKSKAKLNERFQDIKAEAAELGNINHGLSDDELRSKAAQGIALEQKADLAKKNAQISNYARLASDSKQRIDQSQQRIGIALTNAQTAQQRLAQSGANAQQRAQNESVVNQLKALGSHAASLRREHATQAEILNSMNTNDDQKKAAEAAIQGINKDLNDLDVQQRTITGAPARGAKGTPPPSVGGSAGGTTHPNAGKAFKNPDDGKWYIADEIDAQGNITKYHPRP